MPNAMKASKSLISLKLFLVNALLILQGYSEEVFPLQSWKNQDGKVIEASLVSIPSEGKVIINLKNSGQKHTLTTANLAPETLEQLEDMVKDVKSQWSDEDTIPTASLAYKAAALNLPQRKRKKVGEFQYLKVVSFSIKNGGREVGVLLESNLAVEFLPTGSVRFFQSGNNLMVKTPDSNADKLVLATKGAVFPMELSGPMKWGSVGITDCPVFTKLVSVSSDGRSLSVDGSDIK